MNLIITCYFGKTETIGISDIDPDYRYIKNLESIAYYYASDYVDMTYVVCTGCFEQYERVKAAYIGSNNIDFYFYSQDLVDKSKGNGYLEYALLHKFFININAPSSELFCKISGKYIVSNLNHVKQIYDDSTESCGWAYLRYDMVDARCVIISSQIFVSDEERSNIDDNDGYYFEHFIFDRLSADRKYLLAFRPIISGLSGTDGVLIRPSIARIFLVYIYTSIFKVIRYAYCYLFKIN